MNILIVRAFVKLRTVLATHIELANKLNELEQTQLGRAVNLEEIWKALQSLLEPPVTPKRRIGFNASPNNEDSSGLVDNETI